MSASHRRVGAASTASLRRRFWSFSFLPVLSSLSPLLALPVIARTLQPAEWASLLTAQAVGGIGAVIVQFGWSTAGRARVARATTDDARQAVYRQSLRARLWLSLAAVPMVAALATLLATPSIRIDCALMAIAFTLYAFTPGWYGVGVGSARIVALYEAIPRMTATTISAAVVATTGAVISYPILLIAIPLAGALLFNKLHMSSWVPVSNMNSTAKLPSGDASAAGANVLGALYASAPLPISAIALTSDGSADVASIDRLYRYGLLSLIVVASTLHAWALDPHSGHEEKRQRFAIRVHVAVGVLGGIFLLAFGPLVTRLLFGSDLGASSETSAGYAAAFLAVAISTPLSGNLLIPYGRAKAVAIATVGSAALGVPLMFTLGHIYGASGIAIGFAASELLALILMSVPATRCIRSLRSNSTYSTRTG